MRPPRIVLLLSCLGVTTPDLNLRAQASCSFDQCGLAFRRTFWSRYLVRGDSAVPVARIGFIAPALPDFVARQDSVGAYFRQFRSGHTSGNWFMLLGAIGLAAGSTWVYGGNYEGVGVGISVLGLVAFIVGGERWRSSENALQRGIWLYNRELVR